MAFGFDPEQAAVVVALEPDELARPGDDGEGDVHPMDTPTLTDADPEVLA